MSRDDVPPFLCHLAVDADQVGVAGVKELRGTVAGATLEGTEFHLTLIDNLSAADVAELEGVINSSLLLEEYLEELPLTLSRAVAPTVTLEAQGLLLENNQLKAVVVATSHNVPEPATATLSLLALAGLAARHRRR